MSGYYAHSFTFLYVVSPGDATLDLSYSDITGLTVLNSTEVVDESGANVNMTLPEVGSPLSVTGGDEWEREGALIVDTSNVVLYVVAVNEDGVYYAGASILLQVQILLPRKSTPLAIERLHRVQRLLIHFCCEYAGWAPLRVTHISPRPICMFWRSY